MNKVNKKGTNKLQSFPVSLFPYAKHGKPEKNAGSYSLSLSLEKQKFPVAYNDGSIIEKEFVYHTLINNCFTQAFFLVDKNRQLMDYFVDYLIRFQILRQHQILYLFSTMLLRCKKEK